MHKRIKFTQNMVTDYDNYLEYDTESICPICKASIAPIYIASSLDSEFFASVFNYCQNCNNTFLTKYKISCNDFETYSHNTFQALEKIYSEPNHFENQKFDDKIIKLSPQFDKIYNQALAAESSKLDEIAGLGYRKALEFLVKDFAAYIHPDKISEIENSFLGNCISTYIDNEKIKTLATASAWLGNDETHYIRKHQNYNSQDLKRFINTLVAFIEYELNYKEATDFLSNPR